MRIRYGSRVTRRFPGFLLEGDVFFVEDALRHLLHSRVFDVAAIVPFAELMEGSAVLLTDSEYEANRSKPGTEWTTAFQYDEPTAAFSAPHQGERWTRS
ncbi:hypothetical protein [Bradyrhizobium vignae]|uniref:hypothetical protein n=1 Tax=Bradyrhizobium vignae TaxID=1549949 RepID=UPI003221DF59